VALPAYRGAILDRSGHLLASNTMFVSFGADPVMLGPQAGALSARFARVFGRPAGDYLRRIRGGRRFVWLERKVDPRVAARINPAQFPGLIRVEEPQRLYHEDELAGQVIGFTSVDNHGLSGIELQYDAFLRGTDGYMIMQRDGLGRNHLAVDFPRVEPVNGSTVELTVDAALQAIAERELRHGVERTGARSGLVVMMDPTTGEVLALSHAPPLNPNRAARATPEVMKPRSITDVFEPGSVFKLVTAAAALEHDIVPPSGRFDAEQGSYSVRGRPQPITDTHPHGIITFREAMEVSSNIVMAKISDRVGVERFYTTARDFGFGIATGIELPGEVSGGLKKPTQWSATSLNSMAYGYEVGVTPLQIAAAYAAVANRGVLVKPWIVRRVVDAGGETLHEGAPQIIRRVISARTADTLSSLLCGAVERGTGTLARIPGVRIAGKTGTSRKMADGKYEIGVYTASFVGFLPAEDPRLLCLVMLDAPRAGGYTGGTASAPIFNAIVTRALASSSRFDTRIEEPKIAGRETLVVPDVTAMTGDAAEQTLEDHGFEVERQSGSGLVLGQSPSPGTRVERGATVRLLGAAPRAADGAGAIVPDVRGLPIRRALTRLTINGLQGGLDGSGIVRRQTPAPGTRVRPGARVQLVCTPPAPPIAQEAVSRGG
jgi:cell division protein FtsI (penicillin-binding protein 3)